MDTISSWWSDLSVCSAAAVSHVLSQVHMHMTQESGPTRSEENSLWVDLYELEDTCGPHPHTQLLNMLHCNGVAHPAVQ